MSLTKAMQLSLQSETLNGKTLKLSFHGILNKILDEILTIKVDDLEEVILSFHIDGREELNEKWEELKDLNERDYSGIYFLWAKNRNLVYIGQASNKQLKSRLSIHYRDRDWWNRCIFVTTKDNHFDVADLDYLEYTFIDKAEETGIVLDNGDRGNRSGNPPSEQEKELLNAFIENIMSILEALEVTGINIFKDKRKASIRETKKPHRNWSKEISKEKFCLMENGCDGTIVWQKAEEFVLKKGSKLASSYKDSLDCRGRERLESETRKYGREGFIESRSVVSDISFESLNRAVIFCCRASVNAWTALKNKEGKSIDEVCEDIYETANTTIPANVIKETGKITWPEEQ